MFAHFGSIPQLVPLTLPSSMLVPVTVRPVPILWVVAQHVFVPCVTCSCTLPNLQLVFWLCRSDVSL